MPTTFEFLAHFVKWMLSEIGTMLRWFSEEGFVADIAMLKRMNPRLMSLGEWIPREELDSDFLGSLAVVERLLL